MFRLKVSTIRCQDQKVAYFKNQVPGPKSGLIILRVSLTHLVESRELFFLKHNIFQWDVLKNMGHIKSYDDMFQIIRALTVQKILKKRILSQKFLQNEIFPSFSLKCFDLQCTPRKDTTLYFRIPLFVKLQTFYFEENCLSFVKLKEIMKFRTLWQMKIEIGSYKD